MQEGCTDRGCLRRSRRRAQRPARPRSPDSTVQQLPAPNNPPSPQPARTHTRPHCSGGRGTRPDHAHLATPSNSCLRQGPSSSLIRAHSYPPSLFCRRGGAQPDHAHQAAPTNDCLRRGTFRLPNPRALLNHGMTKKSAGSAYKGIDLVAHIPDNEGAKAPPVRRRRRPRQGSSSERDPAGY